MSKKSNPIADGIRFVTEAKNELKKVTWPGRKETTSITIVVIASVFLIGFYLAIVDWGLSEIIKAAIR